MSTNSVTKTQSRPRQNYLEMGLQIGDQLVFERLPGEIVHVASAHRLQWRGQEISLTRLREILGDELGLASCSGRILAGARSLDDLYDQTYGPAPRPTRSGIEPPASNETAVQFSDIVNSPDALMGVKAVWGQIHAPVVCFAARGEAKAKQEAYYSTARATAELALGYPYLVTVGGGAQVPKALRGRVIDLVRVTGVYGETSAFVGDGDVAERLRQWPVAVVLTDMFSVVGWPDLIDDLGFPDRRILTNAFDRVAHDTDTVQRLWESLRRRQVIWRRDIARLPNFRDPGKLVLCQSQYPKILTESAEGKKLWKMSLETERDRTLAFEVKRANKRRNGDMVVCEGCDFSDKDISLFDAHHLNPISTGERISHVADFAVLCPTCHRWAHKKGPSKLKPLTVEAVRAERLF